MSIPEPARVGFGAGADAYQRSRPSYPAEAVSYIVSRMPADATVLDLAAGTGIFTALLAGHVGRLVAVEPVEAMRAKIEGAHEVLDGTAESIPLPDASVDAVTVAQAFHWFRFDEALSEIARVLRPGGLLAMVWNRRDESVPWVHRMSEVIEWRAHQISSYDRTDWPAVIGGSGRFGGVEHQSFPWAHMIDRAGLADRVRSVSYIAAMEADRREALAAEVVALAADFPEPFPLPYNTLVWCTTRS
ncbi:MAG TPA: class I SAM-dependent methyltransferase [Acidimicrobiales bacterium]|jgi:SAM-dependent methyltransferase|nr:class I SAM-dependent methyltransferase [Acidimicrobiales bacterium]